MDWLHRAFLRAESRTAPSVGCPGPSCAGCCPCPHLAEHPPQHNSSPSASCHRGLDPQHKQISSNLLFAFVFWGFAACLVATSKMVAPELSSRVMTLTSQGCWVLLCLWVCLHSICKVHILSFNLCRRLRYLLPHEILLVNICTNW